MLSKNNADGTKENAGNGGIMKKTVSILLTTALAAGMLAGCGGNSSETKEEGSSAKKGDYDLTLYSINTTDPDFDDWLKNVDCSSYGFRHPPAEDNHHTLHRRQQRGYH